MEQKRIILNTNDLNRHGYWISTEGIDLNAFKKNPVLFYDHSTWHLPIGKWKDIKVKEGVLSAIPVFDEKDPKALEVKQKYEDGFINCASVHVRVLEESQDTKLMKAGQKYATVTRSEMLEGSLVGIPGNGHAVTLSFGDVASDNASAMPHEIILTNTNLIKMKKLAAQLRLSEDATEEELVAAIKKLQNAEVESVVALGLEKGVITEANEALYRKLAATDTDSVRKLIESTKTLSVADASGAVVEKPVAQVAKEGKVIMAEIAKANAQGGTTVTQSNEDRKSWTFDDWQKKDTKGLIALRNQDPNEYDRLAKLYYENKAGYDVK